MTEPNNHDKKSESPDVEGRYTEVDGQAPEAVAVHGDYTAEEGHPASDSVIAGEYTDVESDPDAHDRDGIEGQYTDSDEIDGK